MLPRRTRVCPYRVDTASSEIEGLVGDERARSSAAAASSSAAVRRARAASRCFLHSDPASM